MRQAPPSWWWAKRRQRRRDREAAAILERAAGVCDNCGATHGERHGPLIACVNGIAMCRECQQRRGTRPLGAVLCPGGNGGRAHA